MTIKSNRELPRRFRVESTMDLNNTKNAVWDWDAQKILLAITKAHRQTDVNGNEAAQIIASWLDARSIADAEGATVEVRIDIVPRTE